MKRFLAALALTALLVAAPSAARGPATLTKDGVADISAFLAAAVARKEVPGLVALVVNRDGVVYHEAFGMQDVARNIPMRKDTIFRIASMTKPLTSMGAMKLVEEGRLSLDGEASTWIPWLKAPKVLTAVDEQAGRFETQPATHSVTIRHLLTHTSGIGYTWSDPGLDFVQRTTSASPGDLPLLHEPGGRWTYGASTEVVGRIIERISGARIDAYLQASIFGPLGMHDTVFEVPREKYARVATTHQKAGSTLSEIPNPDPIPTSLSADGGLFSTAGDYGRFVRMLLNEGDLDGTRVLSADTVREVRQPHMGDLLVRRQPSVSPQWSRPFPLGAGTDTWGLGFQLTGQPAEPYARSPGSLSWAGIFNTHFWVDPTRQIGAVLLMQTLPFYDEAAIRLLEGFETRVYRALK